MEQSSSSPVLEGEIRWSRADDVAFESALVRLPDGTEDRWRKIADEVGGGKYSPEEVENHFDALVDDVIAICSGLIPLPKYSDEVEPEPYVVATKVKVTRKKGKAWSAEEHKLFLQGLLSHGKGDWRSISRNIVKTKTSTQVASHAQKYYKRLEAKEKGRRTSIHDITLDDSISMQNPLDGSHSLGYDNGTNVIYNQTNSMQNPVDGSGSLGYDNGTNVIYNQTNSMQNPVDGSSSLGYDNGTNVIYNQTNSMQNPVDGSGSLGYDNATNGNYNQESFLVHDSNNTTSPHPNFPNDEAHLQSLSTVNETRNSYYLTSPSSSFLNHGRVNKNSHPSNMYYQEGHLSGCNNVTALSSVHSLSSPNQFLMANNGNTFDGNSHVISPQPQFSSKGYPTNMISQSTPPHYQFQNMNNHMGHQLPNSQTIHMPHRSLRMSNDDTRIVPNVGWPGNQAKAGSTYLPDQSPNGS